VSIRVTSVKKYIS